MYDFCKILSGDSRDDWDVPAISINLGIPSGGKIVSTTEIGIEEPGRAIW